MYSELIIRPNKMADDIIFPDVARKITAEACDGVSVPPLLFNRQENGKAIQSATSHYDPADIESGIGEPPVVSFSGGKGFIRIYALGQPGRDLVESCAALVAQSIAKHVGGPFSFDLNYGDCGISIKGSRMYSIHRMVIEKKPEKSRKYIKVDPLDVSDDIAVSIYRGMLSQARWLDVNGNGSGKLLSTLPNLDTLDIDIVEGKPLPIQINGKNFAAGYDLIFSMNATLTGPWQCGHLRSRGYGYICPYIHTRRDT